MSGITQQKKNMNYVKVDQTPIWHRNLKLKGSNGFDYKYKDINKSTLKYIHDLLKEDKIKINNLKIKKIKINEWKKLFNNNYYNSIKKAIIFN